MMDYSVLPYCVEPMRVQDIDAIMEIEFEAFSAPWSARAYDYELHYNEMAHYYVARAKPTPFSIAGAAPGHAGSPTPQSWWRRLFKRGGNARAAADDGRGQIVGYAGFWMMADEAHISTLAAHRDWRRRGIGELLLLAMIDGAVEIGANVMTLEVRVSNQVAQRLYRKYGFQVVGERKHYYSDNGEDALIMTTPKLTSLAFQRELQELKAALFARLSR